MFLDNESYKAAGVDINAGYKAVELMKAHIKKTNIPGVLGSIGGFGGLFEPNLLGIKAPVFVASTDGVGTKIKIAFLMDKHDTIGIDCVAMCVNDLICVGATPLFFLDYLALGKLVPEKVATIVKGISEGCISAGCALIGGETAEMPGIYKENEYDLAGFSIGMVDKEKILDKDNIKHGDIIIALSSSGIHSNGFSLVRKVFDVDNTNLDIHYPELSDTLGATLLTPTKIYVKPVLELFNKVKVKSIAHITGGGLYENLPRAIPNGLYAKIDKGSVKTPVIFEILKKKGKIEEKDMFSTFNMGIGMCLIVDKEDADLTLQTLLALGEDAYVIGEIEKGNSGTVLC